jgi:uncharacterized protein
MHQSLRASLSDAELDDLERYLASIPAAMPLGMLDGFFAALVCSPRAVPPSVFFPLVWGEDHEFASMEEAKKYSKLVIRHWNAIAGRLKSEAAYDPVRLGGGDGSLGNAWAAGFMQGVRLDGQAWRELFDEADTGGFLAAVPDLARRYADAPGARPEPVDGDRRELVASAIASLIPRLYRYFSRQRSTQAGG